MASGVLIVFAISSASPSSTPSIGASTRNTRYDFFPNGAGIRKPQKCRHFTHSASYQLCETRSHLNSWCDFCSSRTRPSTQARAAGFRSRQLFVGVLKVRQ